MSNKRERDEIKLEKAHLKEHKAIADKISHLENAVGILMRTGFSSHCNGGDEIGKHRSRDPSE